MLKELYCISEAPLDILKFVLWFVIRDVDFSRKQWFPCAKICEDTNHLNTSLSSGVTNLQIMVAFARSVGWGRNEAVIPVSHNLYKCSDV